jgi:uncharacterized protein YgiM (DUF1202 family)
MTAWTSCLLLLVTLALASCASESKQAQTTPSSPSTAPGSAPAGTTTSQRPSSTPTREEATKQPAATPQRLVVSVAHANMREKPDAKSHIVQVLTKGTKLVVVSKGDQWYRVRLDGGREGWVAESVVTPATD